MAHPDHGGSPAAFRRCLGALRVASASGAEVWGAESVETEVGNGVLEVEERWQTFACFFLMCFFS